MATKRAKKPKEKLLPNYALARLFNLFGAHLMNEPIYLDIVEVRKEIRERFKKELSLSQVIDLFDQYIEEIIKKNPDLHIKTCHMKNKRSLTTNINEVKYLRIYFTIIIGVNRKNWPKFKFITLTSSR